MNPLRFDERPVLVFWEVTRACPLACAHCRASAISTPLPGELTTAEGLAFLDSLLGFGKPYPTVILTGGDPLARPDLLSMVGHARSRGLNVAVSPAVSPALSPTVLEKFQSLGVASVSVSLDGGTAATHEALRRSPGHFNRTLSAIEAGVRAGLRVQVNSTVTRTSAEELPELFRALLDRGVRTWEVFFLIRTGRGIDLEELSASQAEDVCHFLYDASQYGILVRAVEAPFLRRVLRERQAGGEPPQTPLYRLLRERLHELAGPATHPTSLSPQGTLDGDGILFVGYDGTIYPGGFAPVPLGRVPGGSVVDIYRGAPTLRKVRLRELHGACGTCSHRGYCGGSRARALAAGGDLLGPDPACIAAVPFEA
jgi:radical SAM protein